MGGLIAMSCLAWGCPEEEEAVTTKGASFEVPDRIQSSEATMLLRIGDGDTTTSSAVHEAMAKLFSEQGVAARDALLRGPYPGKEGTAEPSLDGGAWSQVELLLKRVLVEEKGLFTADEAVDACGNPMLAAFVTSEILADLVPTGADFPLEEVISPSACPDGCDTTSDGVWDVTFTEARFDGMLDAFVQVFPEVTVTPERPAILGHVSAFFLTDNNPGFWQIPLWVSAEKAVVSVQALLQKHHSYTEAHYDDRRAVYAFPHKARTVAAKDLAVTLLGDALCDEHYQQRHSDPLPFGCQLEDGRNLPVQLDVGSELGKRLYRQAMSYGEDTAPLEAVASALTYQLSAFLACPTFDDNLYVESSHVDVMVCPELGVEDCVAWHDIEDLGCDYEAFEAVQRTVPSTGLDLALGYDPYLLEKAVISDPLMGGGGEPSGMSLRVSLDAGDVVAVMSPAMGRLTFLDADGQQMALSERPNTHCGSKTMYEWVATASGTHTILVDGDQDLRLVLTDLDTQR